MQIKVNVSSSTEDIKPGLRQRVVEGAMVVSLGVGFGKGASCVVAEEMVGELVVVVPEKTGNP